MKRIENIEPIYTDVRSIVLASGEVVESSIIFDDNGLYETGKTVDLKSNIRVMYNENQSHWFEIG